MRSTARELFLDIGPGDAVAWKFVDRGHTIAHSKESGREVWYRYIAPEMEPFEAQIESIAEQVQEAGGDRSIGYYGIVTRQDARTMGLCRASTSRKILVEYYWNDEDGGPLIQVSLPTSRVTETVAELETMRAAMIALMDTIERTLEERRAHRESETLDSSP